MTAHSFNVAERSPPTRRHERTKRFDVEEPIDENVIVPRAALLLLPRPAVTLLPTLEPVADALETPLCRSLVRDVFLERASQEEKKIGIRTLRELAQFHREQIGRFRSSRSHGPRDFARVAT